MSEKKSKQNEKRNDPKPPAPYVVHHPEIHDGEIHMYPAEPIASQRVRLHAWRNLLGLPSVSVRL
jgi:hypothetical protein